MLGIPSCATHTIKFKGHNAEITTPKNGLRRRLQRGPLTSRGWAVSDIFPMYRRQYTGNIFYRLRRFPDNREPRAIPCFKVSKYVVMIFVPNTPLSLS